MGGFRTVARATRRDTLVGEIETEVLDFTAAEDRVRDQALVVADCFGTAAHVTALAELRPPVLTRAEAARVRATLRALARQARRGAFRIRPEDQDAHLAIERALTERLGELGRKVHTGRSRNDQAATAVRLYTKEQLFGVFREASELAGALLALARKHATVPMVGRTHMQPAMPTTVGHWAAAHAESLREDLDVLARAYEVNDACPLGSAAGYGVPLPLDRRRVAALLGFSRPCASVVYAGNARGKVEAVVISALSIIMLTLSRWAEDLLIFSMPEFGYVSWPAELGTGSSLMPQKVNPDILELVRARAASVGAAAAQAFEIMRALPTGYNRDVQEIKGALMAALGLTRSSLRVLTRLARTLRVHRDALQRAFTPAVWATDEVLRRVGEGRPFRTAYAEVKRALATLALPEAATARRRLVAGTRREAGVDVIERDLARRGAWFVREERAFRGRVRRLLGVASLEAGPGVRREEG